MTGAASPSSAPVSPALTPPPGNPRFPLTDSLRGVAALCVLGGHAAAISTMHDWWLGRLIGSLSLAVDLFFVLSGLLLYRPFVSALARGKPPLSIRRFARRRLLRIVPTYWAALTVLAIWPGLPDVHTGHWWIYYGLVHVYGIHTLVGGLGVTWTLCIELTFYLALPLYAIAMRRWSRGRLDVRKELVALTAMALLPSFVQLLTLKGVVPVWVGFNTLLGYCNFFALGMALAVVSAATGGRDDAHPVTRFVARRGDVCWAIAALAYVAISVAFYVGPSPGPLHDWLHVSGSPFVVYMRNFARFALFMLVSGMLVAPAVFGRERGGIARRVMSWRPLVAVGVISYSLSLWHGALLGWLAPRIGRNGGPYLLGNVSLTLLVAALAVSLPVAWVSYRLFELPFLKRKDPPPPRPAAEPTARAVPPRVPAPAKSPAA